MNIVANFEHGASSSRASTKENPRLPMQQAQPDSLDAILAGERDPIKLAGLCNRRVRSSRETVAKSLEGDYRVEALFASPLA
jgi:hypothetical protein